MPRTPTLPYAAIVPTLAAACAVVLVVVPSVSASDRASEISKARRPGGQGGDPAKIRELREVLRQAERDQALRKQRAADAEALGLSAPAAPAAEAPAPAPPTGEAKGAETATRSAGDADAATAEASDKHGETPAEAKPDDAAANAAPKKRVPRARPGCMYSGNRLFWERTPGSCGSSPG